MGQIGLMKSGVFIAIFIVSIISFATLFAIDNGSDISIADDPRFTNLNTNLTSQSQAFNNATEESKGVLYNTSLEPGDENSLGGAPFKVGPFEAATMTVTGFSTAFAVIFGGDSQFTFVLELIVGLIVIITALYVAKTWFGRNPD